MRFLVLLCALGVPTFGAIPPALDAALKSFRADPPRGWSFTQTIVAEGKSMVERSDATKPEFARWSLLEMDGRAPSAEELARYAENRSRRSRGGTAPGVVDQLNLDTLETVSDSPERTIYRCQLRPAESGDKTANFLCATLMLHKPTLTLESIELGSTGEFSPTLAVTITRMKTTLSYHLAAGDIPARLHKVTTQVRGRAFWFKSLDADMTVTFSDYERATARKR